jgi:predicted transcriptional regulator
MSMLFGTLVESFISEIALLYIVKYRSRTDIAAAILKSATEENGAGMTRIMYNSFLSFNQIKEYLSLLVTSALLEYHEGNRKYKTTTKGKRFLKLYENVDELLKTVPHSK